MCLLGRLARAASLTGDAGSCWENGRDGRGWLARAAICAEIGGRSGANKTYDLRGRGRQGDGPSSSMWTDCICPYTKERRQSAEALHTRRIFCDTGQSADDARRTGHTVGEAVGRPPGTYGVKRIWAGRRNAPAYLPRRPRSRPRFLWPRYESTPAHGPLPGHPDPTGV